MSRHFFYYGLWFARGFSLFRQKLVRSCCLSFRYSLWTAGADTLTSRIDHFSKVRLKLANRRISVVGRFGLSPLPT